MRVAYGDSNVLRCNVQFAYDRFFTEFTRQGDHRQFAVESPLGIAESKDSPSIDEMNSKIHSTYFENTAIPGDYDYKGDKIQGYVNGIAIPKV